MFYYSSYKTFRDDLTVLRELYTTRLKHYGDAFERIVSTLYVTLVFWKIPFDSVLRLGYVKELLNINANIEAIGVKLNHKIDVRNFTVGTVVQVISGFTRLLSVWIMLWYLKSKAPIEVLLQASGTNILAMILTSHYCFYTRYLYSRHKIINGVLAEIRDRKSWEQLVLVRSKQAVNLQKVREYQDKYICEKIRACAKAYGLLFDSVESILSMFGFSLVCTFLYCLLYIVLYLFYFMEATAGGLFHDTQRYTYFLIYVFWQIVYAVGVIFLNVHFSDATVVEAGRTSYVVHEIINSAISPAITEEALQFSLQLLHQVPVFTACGLTKIDYTLLMKAKKTSYIVHEIINSDMSPQITAEALQLSKQLLHQIPVFTACGLTKIDYPLFLKGTSSVTTFLVILLQFVMD
ncbi:7tm chemosensory receptor domain-containing protein [Phthorimaea operculella]|nr:7tm chemosensory receptor domain-containing protein [Phthorimaea operculella]